MRKCDICGDKITTDEINSGKSTNVKLYPLIERKLSTLGDR